MPPAPTPAAPAPAASMPAAPVPPAAMPAAPLPAAAPPVDPARPEPAVAVIPATPRPAEPEPAVARPAPPPIAAFPAMPALPAIGTLVPADPGCTGFIIPPASSPPQPAISASAAGTSDARAHRKYKRMKSSHSNESVGTVSHFRTAAPQVFWLADDVSLMAKVVRLVARWSIDWLALLSVSLGTRVRAAQSVAHVVSRCSFLILRSEVSSCKSRRRAAGYSSSLPRVSLVVRRIRQLHRARGRAALLRSHQMQVEVRTRLPVVSPPP